MYLNVSSKCFVSAFQNFVANIKGCYLSGYFSAVEINFRILCIWIFSGIFPDVITQCVRRYMLAGLVNKHEKFIIFRFQCIQRMLCFLYGGFESFESMVEL